MAGEYRIECMRETLVAVLLGVLSENLRWGGRGLGWVSLGEGGGGGDEISGMYICNWREEVLVYVVYEGVGWILVYL